ncbi:MAG: ATP-binding cassette domain-containing protein [Clostridia bacterium]
MENQLILKCENLHKQFGKKEILKDVSVEVYAGDILGFIGPNGAGKTTTIKLILGLQSISSGKVEINGYDIEKQFTKAIEKVGTIVENPDLYMYLTGYQNLKLMANLYPNVKEERIQEVVKQVGLKNRIHDKVSKYSLGMRQRLGIAQAILHKPNLLILDEPTNGLDPEGMKEMRELLQMLAHKEQMAVFISSHNLAELENFCNKICIIKNGMVVETSHIDEVKKQAMQHIYLVEVNDVSLVKPILPEITRIDKNHFSIEMEDKELVPQMVKTLVEQNIRIYSMKEKEISLEDAFLKKTGGNIID